MRQYILIVAIILLCGFQSAFGQLQKVTLSVSQSGAVEPETITVPEGKTLEVAYFSNNSTGSSNPVAVTITIDGFQFRRDDDPSGLFLPGPATLELSVGPGHNPSAAFNAILIYRLTDNTGTGAQQSPFSGSAVVIPEDASGPVEIILESSTDLVNWTAANPGTYGGSTERRFFRVRAVVQSGNPSP
jgi:hypothetical protein